MSKRLKLVGIGIKNKSRKALNATKVLIGYLESHSIDYFVIPSREWEMDSKIKEKIPFCDLSITFGGDGTLLSAARIFSKYGTPIIGINLGGLGFITEFGMSEVQECIECFLNGNTFYEERMMIDVDVYRSNEHIFQTTGLNDLVINIGAISRLIQLGVSTGNRFIGNYRADGIIVSTPTGSTAYSLSAGGPILEPSMAALVITPICPHSLGTRPIVVSSDEVIKIEILSKNRQIIGTIDGQVVINLKYMDEVIVKKSKINTKLVSSRKRSFYYIMREKLNWKG